jgi:hypothetical protein
MDRTAMSPILIAIFVVAQPDEAARSFCAALELQIENAEAQEALVGIVKRRQSLRELPEVRRAAEILAAQAPSSNGKGRLLETAVFLRGGPAAAADASEQGRP